MKRKSTYQSSRKALVSAAILALLMVMGIFSPAKAQTLPRPDHIIIIIEENQPNAWIVGNTPAPLQSQPPSVIAPYINSLAHDTDAVIFQKLYALEHPSQGNYLDFFSGSNQGVLDDNLPANYPFTTPNLARELLDHGYSFATYSQDLPSVGSDAQNSTTGSYARKHNPVTNWVGTGQNQVPDTLNQPFTALPTDFSKLPTVCYIVPDEDSDMHNGSYPSTVTIADYWMQVHCSNLIDWARTHNSLVIYTFDEDDGFYANNIPTIFIGPMVKAGTNSTTYDLYSILRTIEDMYGLGTHAGAAASAIDISDVWKSAPSGINQISSDAPSLRVYPNPASSTLSFDAGRFADASGEVSITDVTGRVIAQIAMPESKKLTINTSEYLTGLYFYHFTHGTSTETGKFTVAHQ